MNDTLAHKCRFLGERYIECAAIRGRCQALQGERPNRREVRDSRFDAGLAESEAFEKFKLATGVLAASGASRLCADLRFEYIQAAHASGLAAFRDAIRSERVA